MMQLIRDKAQGIFVWLIVAFIIITFATFGLSGYLADSAKVNVATVNGVDISETEYTQAYQNFQSRLQQQQGANFRPDLFPESFMRQQVINSLVNDKLFEQFLDNANFSVSAQQIEDEISKEKAFQGEDNKFSRKKYKQVLTQQSISFERYESDIQKQIVQQQLYNGLQNSAYVLDAELNNYNKLKNQQRDVGVLLFDQAQYKKLVNVTDPDIEQYYNSHRAEFMTVETVSIEYVELNLADKATKYGVSENEVKEYYDNNIKLYSTSKEQRKARHILINVGKKTDDATAKKKIDELYAKLTNGSDFSSLAKQASEDPGSAKQGGDLGYFGLGIMDKSFEETTFALKKGEISKPVRSRFGYHIIKLEDIKKSTVKPFNEVKKSISSELQKRNAEEEFYKDVDRLDQLAYESPNSLDTIKDQLNLDIKTQNNIPKSGAGGIFSNRRVIEQIYGDDVLVQARNSTPIELNETHYIVVRLKQHHVPQQRKLEDVQALIKTRLTTQKSNAFSNKAADKALAELLQGKTGEKIALEESAASWTRFNYIARNATASSDGKSPITPEIRKQAFALQRPLAEKPVYKIISLANGNKSIVVVYAVKDGKLKPTTVDEVSAEQRSLTAAHSRTDMNNFIQYIRDQADIVITKQEQQP